MTVNLVLLVVGIVTGVLLGYAVSLLPTLLLVAVLASAGVIWLNVSRPRYGP